MSTIIFEGNTYTFGATVSANPGTGTTSYVFGGLNDGQTYGFIIWAFNGVGPSSIVGPATKTTLLTPPSESRDIISSFAWSYQDLPPFNIFAPSSGTTYNLVASSDNFNDTFAWVKVGSITAEKGYTAPDGSTNATKISLISGGGGNIYQNVFMEPGATYIWSIYVDLSNTPSPNLLASPFTPWKQISPGTASGQYFQIPPGTTGWTRFEFIANYNWNGTTRNQNTHWIRWNNAAPQSAIIYGPQLEKVQ